MHSIGRMGRGAIAAGLLAACAASLPIALACPIGAPPGTAGTHCTAAEAPLGCTVADRHFAPVGAAGCHAALPVVADEACAASDCERTAPQEETPRHSGAADRAWCLGDPSSATRPAPGAFEPAAAPAIPIEPAREPTGWNGVRAIAADRIVGPPPRARPPTRAPPSA
jgi:hypothetical protein